MNATHSAAAVIIANGHFPQHPIPLSIIEKAAYIVCTDGAANDFIAGGGRPDAIVGDCDSISEENRKRFSHILYPIDGQETNDLTKSVLFCAGKGKKEIIIVGGTGKREDHTLGNISLLVEYMERVKVTMVTNYGIFTPIQRSTTFKSFKGQQVSLFCIDHKEVTTQNLKYPLHNQLLSNWWQGTLNESLSDTFSVETSGRVIVFQVYN
ncbi:MAG: thiamine diphosphokinase [Proteiniphilum sp.]|nr:thiamine diphosphokinase [Proteiniphilum sp.]